ncbi:hypothetical protein [Enterococcus sp. AZ109]|uniref:hypothetical protein n=1 Tax=Enterococcus sp. AZ109 TaxID=2774634 RepID=UPI003F23D5D5
MKRKVLITLLLATFSVGSSLIAQKLDNNNIVETTTIYKKTEGNSRLHIGPRDITPSLIPLQESVVIIKRVDNQASNLVRQGRDWC